MKALLTTMALWLGALLLLPDLPGAGAVRAECRDTSLIAVSVDPPNVDPGQTFEVESDFYEGGPWTVSRKKMVNGAAIWTVDAGRVIDPTRGGLSVNILAVGFHQEHYNILSLPGSLLALDIQGADPAECYAYFVLRFERTYWTLEVLGTPAFSFEFDADFESRSEARQGAARQQDWRTLRRLHLNESLALRIFDAGLSQYLFSINGVRFDDLRGLDEPLLPAQHSRHRTVYGPSLLKRKILEDRLASIRNRTEALKSTHASGDPYLEAARTKRLSVGGDLETDVLGQVVDALLKKETSPNRLELCSPSCREALQLQDSEP